MDNTKLLTDKIDNSLSAQMMVLNNIKAGAFKNAALTFAACRDYSTLSTGLLTFLNNIGCVESVNLYELYNPEQVKDGRTLRLDKLIACIYSLEHVCFELIHDEQTLNHLRESVLNYENNKTDGERIISLSARPSFRRYLFIKTRLICEQEREYIDYLIALHQSIAILIEANEQDKLTGLLNRETFDNQIIKIINSVAKDTDVVNLENEQSWIAILDIDHFKQINDNYGHLFGDEILLLFAQLMRQSFRYNDLLFRYGGEEFVLVLNKLNHKDVFVALERFRIKVENYRFPIEKGITVSIGYVMVQTSILPSSLIDKADKALYEAKNNGRNQTLYANTEIERCHSEDIEELF